MSGPSPEARGFRLVVFRHGPAEEVDPLKWPDDDQRPLSADGKTEVTRAARGLAELLGAVDRIATSPAVRASATAELLREALEPPAKTETWAELAPGSPPEPILSRAGHLARVGRDLVVVGHAPTLPGLVGYAILGDPVPFVRLARGGAACLEFAAGVRPGAGILAWLLTRKQLSAVRR